VHKIQPGDLLMLCSDGLTTMLADDEMAKLVQQAGDDLPKTAKALVAAANGRGGEDNITVLLLKFQE
jgi:serine/threonine protein phosphatase PrpC